MNNITSLPSVEEEYKDFLDEDGNYYLDPEDLRDILTQDRDQAYTSLVEGIKAQVKDINGESSVFDDFATDIIEKVENPYTVRNRYEM